AAPAVEPRPSVEPRPAVEPAPFEAPRERPVASAPAESTPLREPAPVPSKENEGKYVVWSSTPSDVQRPGPDER
ncbi:MAG: hypothetical protein ACLPV8_19815, partial [Steroidobacteraceae bacterium]